MKEAFLFRYSQPVPYYTLLTDFTQIHLEKNEKIRDFNLRFHKTLTQIPEDMRPNDLVILGCYKNVMPPNVKYAIKATNIDTSEEAMEKHFEMEDNMIPSNANLDIILGRVQRLSLTNKRQVTFHGH